MKIDPPVKAVIIGSGVGGLTAAIALSRAGFEVEVHEQAAEIREAGAGLWLWSNAIRALELIDMADAVKAAGVLQSSSFIRSRNGAILSDIGQITSEPSVALQRNDLLQTLLQKLSPNLIHTQSRFLDFEQDANGLTVYFENGQQSRADILIGADGVHSQVCAKLFSGVQPQYAGFRAWRAVTEFNDANLKFGMTWGRGSRFGFMPIRNGQVNWFGGMNLPEDESNPIDSKNFLLQRFHAWPAPIAEAIKATDEKSILVNPIYERAPLTSWSKGRVTLLGDAAHPMTPSLGQGACQAIEDAVVLGRCFAQSDSITSAINLYEDIRLLRANKVVKFSRRIDRLIQLDNPLWCWLRDRVMQRLPNAIRRKQLDWLLNYQIT